MLSESVTPVAHVSSSHLETVNMQLHVTVMEREQKSESNIRQAVVILTEHIVLYVDLSDRSMISPSYCLLILTQESITDDCNCFVFLYF